MFASALACVVGCAKQTPDTEAPSSTHAAVPTDIASEPPAEPPVVAATPEPEVAPDCSVARVTAALDGTQPWITDRQQCSDRLAQGCEANEGDACYATALIAFADAGADEAGQERALALLTRACELGEARACAEVEAKRPEPVAAVVKPLIEVPRANASSTDLDVDGLEMRELRCAVARPLLGMLAISASLAKRKSALDKCAPGGKSFVVYWEFAGGKAKNVDVRGGSQTENRCVSKAVAATKAPMDARCGAVVLVGKSEAARASVDALRETPAD